MAKTFYDVLEVSSSAGQETIRGAYEALLRLYSAKAQAGDPEADNRLKFVQTAFEVLSSPQKKALYDQRLATSNQQGVPSVFPKPEGAKPVPQLKSNTGPTIAATPHSGGFGKWAVAIFMGFFSGFMIYFLSALLLTGRGSSPSAPFVFVTFFGGWVLSAYLMQKGAISISKVFSRGFLIGAAEWLLMIPTGMILAGKVVASSADASSDAATAGAAIGGGIFAFLTGGVAVTMAVVCLIGFAVSYFIGREMKPEIRTATRKCPECAEMVQPDAKKCRYCGAALTGPLGQL